MQLNITSTIKSNLLALEMAEKLRENHIDVETVIEEELKALLPQYIEKIIHNVYNIKLLEEK